ncbi:MAG: TIGR00725 family protein [Actinobacteria bacterium]|nr:TIGR00725 family protein [Actinomycetota bacterium]
MAVYVGVVGAGSAEADEAVLAAAEEVGRAVAGAGGVVVSGGLGGVMEAACRGAKAGGGTTVGLLPGTDRAEGNRWLDVAIATGLGEARNVLVVRASDVLIAVGGGFGTLSEIGFALKTRTPVVGLATWDLPGVDVAGDAAEAVARALALLR